MQLIYAQETCSLGVHIMLEELGIPYEGIKVSLKDKAILCSYNPRGYVPALISNDGTLMTEAVSILQFLSESHGQSFMPKTSKERSKCIEWLCYLSSEIHKGAKALFHKDEIDDSYYIAILDRQHDRLQYLDDHLSSNVFLLGDLYTIADMYALGLLRIYSHLGFTFDEYSGIRNYKKELEDSPVIKRVIKREREQRMSLYERDFRNSFQNPDEMHSY